MFGFEDLGITLPSFGNDDEKKTESSVNKNTKKVLIGKEREKIKNQNKLDDSSILDDIKNIGIEFSKKKINPFNQNYSTNKKNAQSILGIGEKVTPDKFKNLIKQAYENIPENTRKEIKGTANTVGEVIDFLGETGGHLIDPMQIYTVFKEPKWKTLEGVPQVGSHDPSEKNTELRDTINALRLIPDYFDHKRTEAEEFRKKLGKDKSGEQKRDFVNQLVIPKSKDRPNEIIMRYDHPDGGNLIGGHMGAVIDNKKYDFSPEKGGATGLTSTFSKPGKTSVSDWKGADYSTSATHNIVHVSDSDKRIIDNNLKKWIAMNPDTDKKDFKDAQKGIYKLSKQNCAHMNAFIFNGTETGEILKLDKPGDVTSPIRMQNILDEAAKSPDVIGDYARRKDNEHWQKYGGYTGQGSTVQEGISLPEENLIDFSKFAKRKARRKPKAQKVGTAKNSPNRRPVIEHAFEGPIEPLVF